MARLAPIPHEEVECDPRRTFTPAQKVKLFERAGGKCDLCGTKVRGKWVAGHVIPWALGGPTTVENGRVEGVECGCAGETAKADTSTAAKCKRMKRAREEGRGRKPKKKIESRGFDTRYRRMMNGKTEVME